MNSTPIDPESLEPSDAGNAGRPGFELTADALTTLRRSLTSAADHIDAAQAERDQLVKSAKKQFDSVTRDAADTRRVTLAQIQHQAEQTRATIAETYETKSSDARATRSSVLDAARIEHQRAVSKAKKKREEAAWLAETMVESSSPKFRNAFEATRGRVAELTNQIDELELALARTLGPAKTAQLAGIPHAELTLPESPTIDGLTSKIESAAAACAMLEKGGAFKALRAKSKTIALATDARDQLANARTYTESLLTHAGLRRDTQLAEVAEKQRQEIDSCDRAARMTVSDADKKMGAAVRESDETLNARIAELDARRARDEQEVQRWTAEKTETAENNHTAVTQQAETQRDTEVHEAEDTWQFIKDRCSSELATYCARAIENLSRMNTIATEACPPWSDPAWLNRQHPQTVPGVVPAARVTLDLTSRLDRLDPSLASSLAIPTTVETSLGMDLPGDRALLIEHNAAGRDSAHSVLRTIMLRILGSFPAGKVRLTMADPIGLGQSFAGFMRLADQEPSPVGLRIWSDPMQIERQLADLTEHMQTVIQKYLRSDYATIEEYNHAAGEIAEPYRFVVIADLHTALTENGAARLNSILESGPRCGVYALLATDSTSELPPTLPVDTRHMHCVRLSIHDNELSVEDERFDETAFTTDEEPTDAFVADLLDRVARAGEDAGRVEVPFDRLVPDDESMWTRTCADELCIPLGRSGAQKIQQLRLGSGTRQHALIAGRTGSGKSTLLHVMITAAAMWHSPDELELYLIDFKKGVEFKAYTGGRVPHVRAVAIESDREFGLSVLKRLDDELTTRGDLFRRIGAQNLANARTMTGQPLPRVMLMIDEFQEFFTEDDEVASEATLLLDRLVRQGRAFGVHVILGSQTLAGAYSLARSTLGQIGVRIALQCSETDSYLILGEDNNAARLLSRPGEAIYNDAGGLVEANSPFQTAWLPDADRDKQLIRLPAGDTGRPAPVVFEGNAPAKLDVSANAFVHASPDRSIPRALLGDAVAIAPPVSAALRKRSGANLVVVGPQPEPALGMLVASAIAAGSVSNTRSIVIDPTPEDDALQGRVAAAISASGINAENGTHLDANRFIAELDTIVTERQSTGGGDPIILTLAGLHRLRSIRKSDDYSFSMDEDAAASPDKQLVNILREGPSVGVWTLAWCDTLTNLERAMDRGTIREFGLRALMQMGASDSAALIDSSAASNLGVNRAILADDEAGTIIKFRPIDLPDPETARRAGDILRA
ncbi:MAG: FtsK/SpoIIIE domain-containing protein [Phycisphaerales bacterium]